MAKIYMLSLERGEKVTSNQSGALFTIQTHSQAGKNTHQAHSHLDIYRFNDDYPWFCIFFCNVITMTLSSFERKYQIIVVFQ